MNEINSEFLDNTEEDQYIRLLSYISGLEKHVKHIEEQNKILYEKIEYMEEQERSIQQELTYMATRIETLQYRI